MTYYTVKIVYSKTLYDDYVTIKAQTGQEAIDKALINIDPKLEFSVSIVHEAQEWEMLE